MVVRGPAFWDRVFAEIEAGSTQAEAATRFGVSTTAIRYWAARRRKPLSAELLPVRVTTEGAVRLELEVGGVIVRLVDGADPAYVAALVRALRSC